MARPPEFIIAGAPRSGTTWLASWLDRHPDIRLAKPLRPEPKFFLVDETYARGLDHYLETWFAGSDGVPVRGEKSTNYLESATAAERIRAALPEVKLIFSLRNPVERAYSNYLFSRESGLESESFEAALAAEAEREANLPERLRFARPHAYASRGLYAELLAPYLARFPRERILVLLYEAMIGHPEETAARVHAFLGVAPRPEAPMQVTTRNETGPAEPMSEAARRRLADLYREPNERLAALLGLPGPLWA